MEKWNSQCEHRQPMEQTRILVCTCDSGVAHCQSQQQCHILRMNSSFEAKHRQASLGAVDQKFCHSRL